MLLLLKREPAYTAFLASLDIAGGGTSVFDSDYRLVKDVGGLPVFPANAGATERIAALKALISPRLVEIRGFLNAAVASGDRRTYLAATGPFVLDGADILGIKATTNIIQALLDLLSVYDLGGALNAVVQLERDGELDLSVWDYSEAKVTLVGSPVPVGDGQGEVVTVEIDSDLSGSMYVRIHAVAK